MDRLPKDDGFILYPNHQGMFDVLAILWPAGSPGVGRAEKGAAEHTVFEAGVCVSWGLCA